MPVSRRHCHGPLPRVPGGLATGIAAPLKMQHARLAALAAPGVALCSIFNSSL
ncbi:MAG TPA: hypothetical protein VGR86_04360 [Steroidobacteraceae bacterium]|nr:hypothetical protein [Steroidobacteraceae bacterium]